MPSKSQTPAALRNELEDWYADLSEIVAEKRANDWVACFDPNGVFAVTTHNNLSTTNAWWYTDRGEIALKERAAYNGGYFWHTPERTMLQITNIRASEQADGTVSAAANFALYSADRGMEAKVHVVGRYVDTFLRQQDRLILQQHQVIIDSETVPSNMGVFL